MDFMEPDHGSDLVDPMDLMDLMGLMDTTAHGSDGSLGSDGSMGHMDLMSGRGSYEISLMKSYIAIWPSPPSSLINPMPP